MLLGVVAALRARVPLLGLALLRRAPRELAPSLVEHVPRQRALAAVDQVRRPRRRSEQRLLGLERQRAEIDVVPPFTLVAALQHPGPAPEIGEVLLLVRVGTGDG